MSLVRFFPRGSTPSPTTRSASASSSSRWPSAAPAKRSRPASSSARSCSWSACSQVPARRRQGAAVHGALRGRLPRGRAAARRAVRAELRRERQRDSRVLRRRRHRGAGREPRHQLPVQPQARVERLGEGAPGLTRPAARLHVARRCSRAAGTASACARGNTTPSPAITNAPTAAIPTWAQFSG